MVSQRGETKRETLHERQRLSGCDREHEEKQMILAAPGPATEAPRVMPSQLGLTGERRSEARSTY